MQEYIEYLDNVLTVSGGLLALFASAMMFRKRLSAAIEKSETLDKLVVIRSMLSSKPIDTTWSGSCPVYWHTESNLNLHHNMRRLHRGTLRSIISRMRLANSEDGRYLCDDFTGVETVNEYTVYIYTFLGSLLYDKGELVSIYLVIPDNVPGLARFRTELLRLNKPTLYIINDPRQAPAMRTKHCIPVELSDPCAP